MGSPLVLKELRETCEYHKIIQKRNYVEPGMMDKALRGNGERMAIFIAAGKTASGNLKQR